MSNIFEDFQEKKKQILALTKQAEGFGWLTKERADEIKKKIENDVLTIGVIGQMKCGKSTFLNAFVFEDDVLPAASTPMTASLSVITYGTEKKITAEFYTKDEWEEQKVTAARDLESVKGNELEESKIKAAKELVEKSAKLGSNLQSYLGKTQNDSFDNLEQYVGADGKYISITKAVKIYYPKDYLKGVEIVDTPGMNDPIVSREERTKEFLHKADVVLMMLCAERAFDSTDKTILFENVRKCGTGKVLIGINKYDISYDKGKNEDEIREYVENEIRKVCSEYKDDTISEIMKEVTPVLLSANMALLSEIPMSKISSNDVYNFDWKNYCNIFEISSQPQFREKSHIDKLSEQVINLIENEKGKILFNKPKNEILAAGTNKRAELEKQTTDTANELKLSAMSDTELDEKLAELEKANRKMNRKLERFAGKMTDFFNENVIGDGMKSKFQDCMTNICKTMKTRVDDSGRNMEKLRNDLREITSIKLPRALDKIYGDNVIEVKKKLKNIITDYFCDINEITSKYIPDFDLLDFLETLKEKVIFQTDEILCSFKVDDIFNKNSSFWQELDKGFFIFRKKAKEGIKDKITDIEKEFSEENLEKYINSILHTKDSIVENIKKETIEEIVEDLKNSIEECKNDKSSREEKVKQLEYKLKSLNEDKVKLNQQIEKIKALSV